MKLTVLGCGDAFGAGGRLQTSFHVARDDGEAFLIDCGVTALIGLERAGLDPARVGIIAISHLHGDHFGGLVWWRLQAQFVGRRSRPLVVVGPAGIEARFAAAAEALYPGMLTTDPGFEMRFVEVAAGVPLAIDDLRITAFAVDHPSGAPAHALRFEHGEGVRRRVIGFSGDTGWVDALREVARGADLYISECSACEEPVRHHMSWRDISRELPDLAARRILLTHMGPAMLASRNVVGDPRLVLAEDGQVLTL